MKFIAHRGNLTGPSGKENHPDHILEALAQGFDVEVDVWIVDGNAYLGHDAPTYEATSLFSYKGAFHNYNSNFTDSPCLWIHCKNLSAMADSCYFHSHRFAHDEDDFVLVDNYIWTYPRNLPICNRSIAVMPERVPDWDISEAYGVCTDYPVEFKKDLKFKP